jgi:hypothetical protein
MVQYTTKLVTPAIAKEYIFGYKCKYGAWDEFELTKEHVEILNQIVKS